MRPHPPAKWIHADRRLSFPPGGANVAFAGGSVRLLAEASRPGFLPPSSPVREKKSSTASTVKSTGRKKKAKTPDRAMARRTPAFRRGILSDCRQGGTNKESGTREASEKKNAEV